MLGWNKRYADVRLSLRDAGTWVLSRDGACRGVVLLHVWPTFAWVTLRLQYTDACHQGEPQEVTVWRSSVPLAEWRALRRSLSAELAMSERSHHKEPQ